MSIVCLMGSGKISIHEERLQISNQVESKTSQFEIVFKSLERFSTQFRVKESFNCYLLHKLRKFGDKSRSSLAT